MKPHFPVSRPSLTGLETEYVMRAVQSGWVSSIGEYIEQFEEGFATFCGTKHAMTVSNGTAALHLSLRAWEIGAGDEVIVPDLSFVATANAVMMAGATPVFCDIERETLCIDPEHLEALITPRTKAIIPVHLYGHPADMRAIMQISARHGLKVIEDAAEAHGAEVEGRRVGGLGDSAIFSFYGNKNLTTGEGGMITSNDAAFIARCRLLRDHAMNPMKRYWHDELGYNYRITNLQAALGCAQLERADELIAGRAAIFELYRDRLGPANSIRLNRTADWARNSYWMVCVEIEGLDEQRREILAQDLKRRGVDCRPYFYPMSDMPHLPNAETPVAHGVSRVGLNLPSYIGLDERDVSYISQQLLEAMQRQKLDA